MKINSMTGFGKGEASEDGLSVRTEIKSVNNRFRDIRLKIPHIFGDIELEMKRMIDERFNRGSFDVRISFKKVKAEGDRVSVTELDQEKIKAYLEMIRKISDEAGVNVSVSPTDFLRSEFSLETDEKELVHLKQLAKMSLVTALNMLEESRTVESQKLVLVLKDHQGKYNEYFSKIEGFADVHKRDLEESLKKRIQEYLKDVAIDEFRFRQEIVYYLEKLDIHEEINRIRVHLEKIDKILDSPGEVGRQIDFLIQELGRETNTIGSKSSVSEISEAVVQMKVQLEKIREQSLNLE